MFGIQEAGTGWSSYQDRSIGKIGNDRGLLGTDFIARTELDVDCDVMDDRSSLRHICEKTGAIQLEGEREREHASGTKILISPPDAVPPVFRHSFPTSSPSKLSLLH